MTSLGRTIERGDAVEFDRCHSGKNQAGEAIWDIDAEWTAEGAICADSIRDFQRGEPACLARLEEGDCGGFSSGALLIDEYRGECRVE